MYEHKVFMYRYVKNKPLFVWNNEQVLKAVNISPPFVVTFNSPLKNDAKSSLRWFYKAQFMSCFNISHSTQWMFSFSYHKITCF